MGREIILALIKIDSMCTIRFIMLKKTHFDFRFGFMHGFLYTNMFPVVASFWVFLSKFIAYVFGSIPGYLFRPSAIKRFAEKDSGACSDSNFDGVKERQNSDHVDQGNREADKSSLVASSSKYEFLYRKGFSGFIKEPKAESYSVHEFYMGSANCDGRILVSRDSADADIGKIEVEAEDPGESFTVEKVEENCLQVNFVDERETEEPVEEISESLMLENVLQKELQPGETDFVLENETEESALRFFFEKDFEKYIKQEESVEEKKPEQNIIKIEDVVKEIPKDFVEKLSEKPKHGEIETKDSFKEKAQESVEERSEKDASDIQGHGDHVEDNLDYFFVIDIEKPKKDGEIFSPRNNVVDVESITHQVLANRLDLSYVLTDAQNMEHGIHERTSNIIRSPINDSDEEFIELEPLSEKLRVMGEDLSIEDEGDEEEFNSMVSPEKTQQTTLREEFIFSSCDEQEEEDNDDDSEFSSEDDDLMERLKIELKLARTGGLPTILEDSESPKMVEQPGPLKIEEKYDHKYHIAEIQKVYKSYSDKMRKLDILNSQTMHAVSLLQLKDPVPLSSAFGRSSAPAIKSLLSHNVWPFKQQKPEADPAMKSIRDLHMAFETVYVGQVCLSWEILHWQYGKVNRLWECDSLATHQYNQAAGKFQRFQVLVQRFLEDEPFQDRPRVENYAKNRCALRLLLQVPVIEDDCSKYKLEGAVSNGVLSDMIEESMHVLWEFLRADKDNTNATSKTPQQAQVAPHDPIDLELLMDVRTELRKKEKRLKEIQRNTNCIIKRLQRQHQRNLLDHTLFIAQVELKLVSRVLNMLKISTDQLIWCYEKLQRINFGSRKTEIEPSFTRFPC
ncbi:hypothetical protein E1A91_D02G150000v1 [Gossypium mustelinum]|uniref:Ribosomal protein L34Ae n=1 Tax=Gossypium mustelinum TaxID=34275 RepID=A0A5D2VWL1_GOSMU|nr:hypothetical protein E1A91_D02G150000v1 [Gossypium mustelinum]